MKKNKIIISGCGGAGVNITVEVMRSLSVLGSGFSEVEAKYLDTSLKNIEHFPEEIDVEKQCFLVKDENFDGKDIDGSSGERRMNHQVVAKTIPKYLDHIGVSDKVNGVYHVVIYSASGGSGSILAPLLVKALTSRGIPTISLVVGDSMTGNLAQNTVNTISSIQSLAKSIKKPMPVYYLNNYKENYGNIEEKITSVNRKFVTFMTGLSMFLSGENFALDNQDMVSLIDFTSLTSMNFPIGAYSIGFYHGNTVPQEVGIDMFMGRTLTTDSVPPDTGVELLHWKSGKVVDEAVFDIISKDQFPLHIILASGKLKDEITSLHEEVTALRKRVEALTPDETIMDENAIKNDDGLIM